MEEEYHSHMSGVLPPESHLYMCMYCSAGMEIAPAVITPKEKHKRKVKAHKNIFAQLLHTFVRSAVGCAACAPARSLLCSASSSFLRSFPLTIYGFSSSLSLTLLRSFLRSLFVLLNRVSIF